VSGWLLNDLRLGVPKLGVTPYIPAIANEQIIEDIGSDAQVGRLIFLSVLNFQNISRASMTDAGISRCPMCGREWLVVPGDDCFLPACGCFGRDTSATNRARPCFGCGMKHAGNCDKMPSSGGLLRRLAKAIVGRTKR
jgi:hypothetical protein